MMTEQQEYRMVDLSATELANIFLSPQTSRTEAWRVLCDCCLSSPDNVRNLRKAGLLYKILARADASLWNEISEAWPHLMVHEVQRILIRAFRSRKTGGWDDCVKRLILRLFLEHQNCTFRQILDVMWATPLLRSELFPSLVRKSSCLDNIIPCLAFKETCELALREIINRELHRRTPFLRSAFAGVERRHLNSADLSRLLVWQFQQEVLGVKDLRWLEHEPGYSRAVRKALKELEKSGKLSSS
jgi:hypothetical protein